jgi:hypothetical protein
MAFNFLKLARALATASLVSGAGSALAQTSVTNTAGATIRVNPYSVTATYDKSSSAAVQANGIGGFNLTTTVAGSYVNPLDALGVAGSAGVTGVTASASPSTSSLLGLGASGCSNANVCRNGASSLLSVANSNPVLADIYAVTDTSGTFSLDISSKNADRFTTSNQITSPTSDNIGVRTSGASSYQVSQQGVAGITATVYSPTRVELNTDAAGGGSTGQISLTAKSLSNGVQETYSTSGSVSIDGASAYIKANTTDHVALNAVNATISGTQSIATGSGTATFTNTDIVATTLKKSYINSDSDLVTDQVSVLASGNYVAKDSLKGATSVKISADPADQLRVIGTGTAASSGFATRLSNGTTTREAAPAVHPLTGGITLPDFSTQTLTASGVSWVGTGGTSASQARTSSALAAPTNQAKTNNIGAAAVARGNAAVSNVVINSAAGGGGVNSITSGGFGNTVNLQTTFDMTVFGR